MPDPSDYDNVDDFVSDCVEERQDENPDEDIDESTSICYSLWEDADGEKSGKRAAVIRKNSCLESRRSRFCPERRDARSVRRRPLGRRVGARQFQEKPDRAF